jgi:hypothetical protein
MTTTQVDSFENAAAEYTKVFVTGPRREAEELCAGLEGDNSYVARIRRQRAGVLRRQATKRERYLATLRAMAAEDKAARSARNTSPA